MQPRFFGVVSGLSILAGIVAGLATVFAYSFTDGPPTTQPLAGQRLVTDAIVFVVYLVVPFLLAWWTGRGDWWWLAWFGAPGLVMLAMYTIQEPKLLRQSTVYAAILSVACLIGAWVGARVAARRSATV